MNLCLHRGDRVAKCSWLNPPTPSMGANKSGVEVRKNQKDPASHGISCFSLREAELHSSHFCLHSLLLRCFSQFLDVEISRMNGILWRCVSSYPQIEIKAQPCFNFPQKTDATDLSSKTNIVTGSPFSQIDYDFPAESSHVAPQVQTFVSLFRIKGKPAWPSKTSNNLNTCRLSLYLSLSLSLSLSPFSQACNPAISCPGNSPGSGSATWTVLPGQDEGAWRVWCQLPTGPPPDRDGATPPIYKALMFTQMNETRCRLCFELWQILLPPLGVSTVFFTHLEHERINISQRQ